MTYDKKVTSAASEQKDKPQINSSLHCVRPTPASALGKVLFFLKEDGRTPLFQGRNKKKERATRTYLYDKGVYFNHFRDVSK